LIGVHVLTPLAGVTFPPAEHGERMTAAPREADAKRLNPRTITIDPLTLVVGAEIGGVDLSKPISTEQFGEIRDAFNAYHVLVFRDQLLTPDDHKRFGRMFGRLHVHPYNAEKAGAGGIAPNVVS
jgi:hypothetical protein